MSDVTRLLEAVASGNQQAASELFPLVYEELRNLAQVKMAQERVGHTLSGTALVHEAYLRLVGQQKFEGVGHFFAAAAEAMRRILVNHARDRKRLKRGGDLKRVHPESLSDLASASDDDLIGLDESLEQLAKEYPQAADIVKLRFFVGMTLSECAEALEISQRTADRQWAFARAWLFEALQQG